MRSKEGQCDETGKVKTLLSTGDHTVTLKPFQVWYWKDRKPIHYQALSSTPNKVKGTIGAILKVLVSIFKGAETQVAVLYLFVNYEIKIDL